MKLTGAEIVCESLLKEGVEVIFGIPGGAVLPFYGALSKYPKLRHILVRHEQGAAMGADGYARTTGRVGVCTATSGPGATNLVTGIACAQMDSVPLVAITGQVSRAVLGSDAFQEIDMTGITLPITKHNYLVMNVEDVASVIKEAFHIARTGRPGPVLVDLPRDVLQDERTEFVWPETVNLAGYNPPSDGDPEQVAKAALLINQAERPIIGAGHGVLISRAYGELRELAEKTQTPVVTTLLGIGSLPTGHYLNLGMTGMHGMASASLAVDKSDLIIALGMRFDDRVTGRLRDFAPNAKVIHIDVDPSELNKNVRADVPIVGDLKCVLQQLMPRVEPKVHIDWLRFVDTLRSEHPTAQVRQTDALLPQFVLRELSEVTQGDSIIVTGVGQHQMWAAQFCAFNEPNTLITSGGLGTMGYEVPAALGAKVGRPDKTVWSIAGDGGFQMTMCDLATAAENKIDVKFAILNNGSLGLVRQLQDLFFDQERFATQYTANPDFVKLAEAYGIHGIRVTAKDRVNGAIQEAMETPGPVVIDFRVVEGENVYPMIPAGASVNEMIEEPASEGIH
ncbi:MAG: biosynthetic-type acetolactate synthase large subunit [Dehalococcoidia bacterium]|nr:biosynthetic-type acetolactate synthase large subunit [Dehalococcoidia bacterium]